MKKVSKNLQDTERIAESLIKEICAKEQQGKACVIGLYGDLGAGKTTLTQSIAKALKINDKITSPTFIIMRNYDLKDNAFGRLFHIDAYRLEKPEELIRLGWEEMIADPKNLILIEWPEKVADIMPKGHLKVRLKHVDENSREVEFDF